MKPGSRRRYTANMLAVNEENGSIFVSAASIMLELGWLRRYVNVFCVAPLTSSGTMKVSVFEGWFEEDLLKKLPKEHVSIMDNMAFHKKEVLYQIVKKYLQELIFLLPYSPEFNSIEHTWSALKRKVADCLHLYSSVSLALDAVLKGN